MKKCYLYAGMLAAGMLAFSACSNDDDPINGGQNTPVAEDEGQVIRIAVANAGDGLTTKAGRPLYSSEAKQAIDKVTVYIVNESGIQASHTFDNWSTDAVSEVYDNHGRQATWKLSADERLDVNNQYTAYAVGYTSTGSLYQDEIESYEGLTGFDKFLSTVTLKADQLGEEIFAGALNIKIDGEGNVDVSNDPEANVLTLHRQVAGTMGYFTSIPTVKPGQYVKYDETAEKYKVYGTSASPEGDEYDETAASNMSLRLVASNISNTIYFDYFNSLFTEAQEDNSTAWFIVNGDLVNNDQINQSTDWSSLLANFSDVNDDEQGYVLYTINLGDWFPYGDVNKDGLLDELDAINSEDWNTPANVQGASFVEGSVFAGTFVIPFAKVQNANTLQLQLVDASNAVVRTWNINLPEDDTQLYPSAGHTRVWNGSEVNGFPAYGADQTAVDNFYGTNFPFGIEESETSYSFVRNHLYSIGEKMTDEAGPGDEPQPLSKGQNLILKVNDNWEMIHHMVVD